MPKNSPRWSVYGKRKSGAKRSALKPPESPLRFAEDPSFNEWYLNRKRQEAAALTRRRQAAGISMSEKGRFFFGSRGLIAVDALEMCATCGNIAAMHQRDVEAGKDRLVCPPVPRLEKAPPPPPERWSVTIGPFQKPEQRLEAALQLNDWLGVAQTVDESPIIQKTMNPIRRRMAPDFAPREDEAIKEFDRQANQPRADELRQLRRKWLTQIREVQQARAEREERELFPELRSPTPKKASGPPAIGAPRRYFDDED